LDVIHLEKNFCENIINTVIDVSGKINDNTNTRLDLEELYARDELYLRKRENGNSYEPKAKYSLSLKQKRSLCEWLCA